MRNTSARKNSTHFSKTPKTYFSVVQKCVVYMNVVSSNQGTTVDYGMLNDALIERGLLEFVTNTDDFAQALEDILESKKTEDSTMVGQLLYYLKCNTTY